METYIEKKQDEDLDIKYQVEDFDGEDNHESSLDLNVNKSKFLFKLDACILTYVCLQYWINYVDRVGFSNAYVTGMKQSLNLTGKDFNLINTCFSVGYIISMIPHNIMLLKVKPKFYLAFCTLVWGVLTIVLHCAKDFKQCCAIRFFQGIFESCTFSGTHLILGSWYLERELPFRSAIFTSSGLIGSLFSGFMQVGIYNSMDGLQGMQGWRWLFIIDGIITMPIALLALFIFPDTPDLMIHQIEKSSDMPNAGILSKAGHYLDKFSIVNKVFSNDEIKYAKKRLPIRDGTIVGSSQDEGAKNNFITTLTSWSVWKRIFGRWHWYLFSLVWALGGLNISWSSNSTFMLFLTEKGYSISQRNHYPMGIFAVGIVATLATSVFLTFKPKGHLVPSICISVVLFITAIMIKTNPNKDVQVFIAQYLAGIAYAGQTVFFSWCNVVTANDIQERAITLASMNMFSGAVNAWWSIIFYPATDVPSFTNGTYAMMATTVATAVVSAAIWYLYKQDELKRAAKINYVDLHEDALR
ncbi:hypothetical protein ACO0R3_001421 [Hanseniaspora guilliermondii]